MKRSGQSRLTVRLDQWLASEVRWSNREVRRILRAADLGQIRALHPVANLKQIIPLTALLLAPLAGLHGAEKPEPAKPTSHATRQIEGWNVRVDDRLLAPPNGALGTRALRFLEHKLSDIKAVVAADPLAKLQAVTIVLDLSHGKLRVMQYHPSAGWLKANSYATNLVKCVHIPEAADLPTPRNITEQPWVVLHELAHASRPSAELRRPARAAGL